MTKVFAGIPAYCHQCGRWDVEALDRYMEDRVRNASIDEWAWLSMYRTAIQRFGPPGADVWLPPAQDVAHLRASCMELIHEKLAAVREYLSVMQTRYLAFRRHCEELWVNTLQRFDYNSFSVELLDRLRSAFTTPTSGEEEYPLGRLHDWTVHLVAAKGHIQGIFHAPFPTSHDEPLILAANAHIVQEMTLRHGRELAREVRQLHRDSRVLRIPHWFRVAAKRHRERERQTGAKRRGSGTDNDSVLRMLLFPFHVSSILAIDAADALRRQLEGTLRFCSTDIDLSAQVDAGAEDWEDRDDDVWQQAGTSSRGSEVKRTRPGRPKNPAVADRDWMIIQLWKQMRSKDPSIKPSDVLKDPLLTAFCKKKNVPLTRDVVKNTISAFNRASD